MASITRKRRTSSSATPPVSSRLLAATERLISGGTPYVELSVEQLCSEAGVARSSFYANFRDKSELISRVTESLLGELAAAASAWWQPGASREQVETATRNLLDVYAEHGPILAALTETAAYDADMRAMQQESLARHLLPIQRMVADGQASGLMRQLPTEETVNALAWMLEGVCYRMVGGSSPAAKERIASTVTAIIWHSLYPDATGEG